jgi:hypothetical protein
MIDEDFLLSLPTDAKEAFPLYEARIRQETIESDYYPSSQNYSFERQYIESIIGFVLAHELDIGISYDVPSDQEEFWDYYRFVSSKIKILSTKMLVQSVRNKKLGLVGCYILTPADKSKIHHYVQQIRDLINKYDLSDTKKTDLLDRLSAFEKEVDLDKSRVELWASIYVKVKTEISEYEPVIEILDSISSVFSKAKEWADALPSPKKLDLIAGPKKSIDELESEIPF